MVHKRVDDTNEELEKLQDRIRTLEKWVAGAGAVIAAATFIIGIIASADAKEINHGSNGSTQSEVVLQLSRS